MQAPLLMQLIAFHAPPVRPWRPADLLCHVSALTDLSLSAEPAGDADRGRADGAEEPAGGGGVPLPGPQAAAAARLRGARRALQKHIPGGRGVRGGRRQLHRVPEPSGLYQGEPGVG